MVAVNDVVHPNGKCEKEQTDAFFLCHRVSIE